jgi:hypothetical protein
MSQCTPIMADVTPTTESQMYQGIFCTAVPIPLLENLESIVQGMQSHVCRLVFHLLVPVTLKDAKHAG